LTEEEKDRKRERISELEEKLNPLKFLEKGGEKHMEQRRKKIEQFKNSF
jgi:hypothetical protein